MLRWRLILGALLIAALVLLCWLDYHAAWPGAYLLPLAIVLSLLGAGELLAMFRNRGHDPLAWVVYAGTLVVVLAAGIPGYTPASWSTPDTGQLGWLAIGLAAGLLLALVGELCRYESPGRAITNLSLACFAIFYVGGLMGFLVQLRLFGGGLFVDDGHRGTLALVSLIATVKMSDTGQYAAGRLFGRNKMAPRVSPGKTWEGVRGGAVFAIVTALLVFGWAARYIVDAPTGDVSMLKFMGGPLRITIYALAVAAAGILGDLAESLLKRDAGVKDSSTWLPGFGGVLDLVDSLLGAAPVAYLFWTLGIVGP